MSNELEDNITKVLSYLQSVFDDCEAQALYLKERGDVNWNCYDIENWQAMAHNLRNAINLLEYGEERESDLVFYDRDDESEEDDEDNEDDLYSDKE